MLGDVNFSIVLSSICSSQSDSIVQLVPINGSVQYTLPVSHSWTNITILVENQYGILSHTVMINQTGMLVSKFTSAKNVVFHLHVFIVTCELQSSTTNGRFMIIKLIVKLPTLSDPYSAIVAVSTFYTVINSPSLLPSPSNNDGKLHTAYLAY